MGKYYVGNIEDDTVDNENFRKVLFTGPNSQLVVMSLGPGEEIGEETHDLDQFICFEAGHGEVVLDGESHEVEDDFGVVIPAGTRHNVINKSDSEPLKLFTVYSPPEHEPDTVHKTKAEADEAEKEHHGK
jgi:mannose-6-phosphate isomerase-like protein (cupin superfamily)